MPRAAGASCVPFKTHCPPSARGVPARRCSQSQSQRVNRAWVPAMPGRATAQVGLAPARVPRLEYPRHRRRSKRARPTAGGHPGRAASGGEVTACRDRLAGEPCGSVGSGSPSRGHWRRCDVVKRVADCPFAGTKAQLGWLSRRATTSADAPAPRRRLRLVGVQLGADRFPVHDAPDLRRCRRPSGPLAHAAACSGSSQSSRYLREKSGERSQRSARSATSTSTRGGAGRLRGGPEVWPQRGLPAPRAAGPRAAVPSLSRLSEARCRFSTDARAARVPIARWRAPAPRPTRQ